MQHQINLAKSGNQIAFYQIWNYYHKSIYYFILNKTHNENLSSEITNTTFMKAFLNIGQYNTKYEFSTWLFTIAKNTFCENIKSKSHLFVDINEFENTFCIIENYELDDFEEEKIDLLHKSINELRPNYKEVIKLRLDNYKYEQIAEITGLSSENIKVILNRAKKKLTTKLHPVAKFTAA